MVLSMCTRKTYVWINKINQLLLKCLRLLREYNCLLCQTFLILHGFIKIRIGNKPFITYFKTFSLSIVFSLEMCSNFVLAIGQISKTGRKKANCHLFCIKSNSTFASCDSSNVSNWQYQWLKPVGAR